jgi:hypothetical protein
MACSGSAKPRRCDRSQGSFRGVRHLEYTTVTDHQPLTVGQVLERHLSVERIGPYRRAAGGELDAAMSLYEWNIEVAGAFGSVIGQFEVVLRNSLHNQLTTRHRAAGRPGQWFDDPTSLPDAKRRDDVTKARRRVQANLKPGTPGQIVAELMFGFWRLLLDKKHQPTLWAQTLRHAFPHLQPQRRQDVYQRVNQVYTLRNRVAHHEPIHHLDLAQHHQSVLEVTAYIDPDVERWLRSISRVPTLLDDRPG